MKEIFSEQDSAPHSFIRSEVTRRTASSFLGQKVVSYTELFFLQFESANQGKYQATYFRFRYFTQHIFVSHLRLSFPSRFTVNSLEVT